MSHFTKDAIKKTFLELLSSRPLDQITVRLIAEACGINRNTFYYHFSDIPSLLMEIISDATGDLIRDYAGGSSLEECLTMATQFARENKKAVMNIYRSSKRDYYEDHLIEICRDLVEKYADAAFAGMALEPDDREVVVRFYQCELIGQTLAWLASDMRYDIQAQFTRLFRLQDRYGQLMQTRLSADPEKP